MAFDGFILKAVVQELQSCLVGGKITKIYQPVPDEIILGIYSQGINYALTCNISFSFYSLHLTMNSKPNPLSAPSFCMLLRKYLIGFKIKNISMNGLERIAIIDLEGYNELNDLVTLKLVIELMGKHSNIILINQNNIIIDSLKHLHTLSGSYRNILPGISYSFPECTKLNINQIADIENFYRQVSDEEKAVLLSSYFIEHFVGTSKTLLDYSISKLKITEDFTFENFNSLLLYLQELIRKIELSQVYCISLEKDYTLDIKNDSVNLGTNNNTILSNLAVNFFLDDYYAKKEQSEEFVQYRNSLLNFISKQLKKIAKKLDSVNDKIRECSNMEDYRLYGELLTSYLYKIDNTHTDHIILENYYNQNQAI